MKEEKIRIRTALCNEDLFIDIFARIFFLFIYFATEPYNQMHTLALCAMDIGHAEHKAQSTMLQNDRYYFTIERIHSLLARTDKRIKRKHKKGKREKFQRYIDPLLQLYAIL